jgi:hypothetical protein
LKIAGGQVFAQTTEQKKGEDFRRFLDAVLAELPADKEIHAIVDNYSTHKRNADWLDKYQAGQVPRPGSVPLHSYFGQLAQSGGNPVRTLNPQGTARSQLRQQRPTPFRHLSPSSPEPTNTQSHSTGGNEKPRAASFAIQLLTYATKN